MTILKSNGVENDEETYTDVAKLAMYQDGSVTIEDIVVKEKTVSNDEELTQALSDFKIQRIKLAFSPEGAVEINRLVDIDLNGNTAGTMSSHTDHMGEVSLLNSGDPADLEGLEVTAQNATFNLGENITITGKTLINDVADGTFNTEAIHNEKIQIKDANGGSVNFTGATINKGIDIEPDKDASALMVIRGKKPESENDGNATVTILGKSPQVKLEGEAQSVVIEAEKSKFHLEETGDAGSITISDTVKGSTITASKYYEFELLFNPGDTVKSVVNSNLFGGKEIRVVGYPSEDENIDQSYLLKLDGDKFSRVYIFELKSFNDGGDYVEVEIGEGKFQVDKENKKVYLDGNVTGKDLRKYLEDNSDNLFEINPTWLDGMVIMSIYDVKGKEVELIESDTVVDKRDIGMRVLVGSNEQHGLYILTLVLH